MSFLSVPITLFPNSSKRTIGEIEVDVIIDESTNDSLTITKQPVQQGASITDHAFKEPTTLGMTVLFRDNLTTSLSKLYEELLELQESRVPFDIATPKRIYRNMLIAVLVQTTDKNTENCLSIRLQFQEVIIVTVNTVQVPRRKQRNAGATGKTENAGKKSALKLAAEGVTGLFRP